MLDWYVSEIYPREILNTELQQFAHLEYSYVTHAEAGVAVKNELPAIKIEDEK